MKVAIISSTFLPSHDGVSITLFERLKKLSELGHSALCFVSSYEAIADIYPDWAQYVGNIFPNVKVVALPSEEWMDVPQERNPQRSSLGIIEAGLEQFQPDIIEIEEPERIWTTLFTLPGLKYAQKQQIPYIGCYRTNFIDYIPDYLPSWLVGIAKPAAVLLTKWLYNQCFITLVGSKFIQEKLENWGIHNVDYVQVIGPPVITDREQLINSNFFAENYSAPEVDHSLKILFLGRLSPDKNWQFTLEHLPQLKEQQLNHKITILVAGTGELAEQIKTSEFAQVLPTVFLGKVSHEQVPQLLANIDFHVTASLKETFGRTVQESLYVGTPVLAPDCDWTRNLIQPNENGILYDVDNGKDFIQQLTTLINNDGDRQRLAVNIQQQNQQISQKNDPTYQWIDYLQAQINQWRSNNTYNT